MVQSSVHNAAWLHSTVLFQLTHCSLYTMHTLPLHNKHSTFGFTQSTPPPPPVHIIQSLSHFYTVQCLLFTQCSSLSHLYTVQCVSFTQCSSLSHLYTMQCLLFTQCSSLSHLYTVQCLSFSNLHSAVLSPIFLPLSAWKQANNTPINLSQVVVTNAFKRVIFCDPVFRLSVHLGFVLQAEKTGHINT